MKELTVLLFIVSIIFITVGYIDLKLNSMLNQKESSIFIKSDNGRLISSEILMPVEYKISKIVKTRNFLIFSVIFFSSTILKFSSAFLNSLIRCSSDNA